MISPCRILHARFVYPITGEPIKNGVVGIDGGRITSVGIKPQSGEQLDLGNVALLPGLVNAHTHLEMSGIPKPLGSAAMGFVDWIRQVIEWRGKGIDPKIAIAAGLQECVQNGVTMLGNIAQLDDPEVAYENHSVEGIRFFEIIAPNRERMPPVLDYMKHLSDRQTVAATTSWHLGLSPHAPYSVHPDLLLNIASFSATKRIPLAMHLAESREEVQLLSEGTGPLSEFLEERNLFDATIFPGGKRPLDYLKMLSGAQHVLIVHGNYLDDDEIEYLADHSAKMAVVYCPRTHAFFGHDPYPLEKILAAGVTLALGTDSRASSPDSSLLAEIRFAARQHPQISRERILKMGTIDAARALGFAEEFGSLEPGKAANFVVVALPEENVDDPYRLLFESDAPVAQTWFRGQRLSRGALPTTIACDLPLVGKAHPT